MIKAIPTFFNGIYFRSRLEARWALFFKEIGIRYTYEPEAFDLPSGNYLPDFYFPEHKCYGEIKPEKIEDKRWVDLVCHTDKPIMIFIGSPTWVPQLMYEKDLGCVCDNTCVITSGKYYPFYLAGSYEDEFFRD